MIDLTDDSCMALTPSQCQGVYLHMYPHLYHPQVLHIHCRHGDGDFSKFEFFRHHYDNVDLSKLNIRVVRDYAMLLATSTWRGIGKGKYDAKKGRDEL